MAQNSTNDISWFFLVKKIHRDYLAEIRKWDNLKLAFEADDIWVTGFEPAQLKAKELKSIPYGQLYYANGPKLFLQHSRLPERNVPALLWTPIQRTIPVSLPSFNHNYFGTDERIQVSLIPVEDEQKAVALLTTLEDLEAYIQQAAAIRLQALSWTILAKDKVLIMGEPLLPIMGEAFWKRKNILLPAGYDFDLHLLSGSLNQRLSPNGENWILWKADNRILRIPKENMKPLSIASFRLTHMHNQANSQS